MERNDIISEALNKYYDNIIFTLVKQEGYYSVYAAKIGTFVGYDDKFLFAVIPQHMSIKQTAKLPELYWVNFQTRHGNGMYKNLPKQYISSDRNSYPSVNFSILKRENEKSTYRNQKIPVELNLFHNPKKRTIYQFNDTINLGFALNTWDCIITMDS